MEEVILENNDKQEIEELLTVIRKLESKEQRELLIFIRGMVFARKHYLYSGLFI